MQKFIFLIIFFCSSFVFGQKYNVRNYNIQDGLASNIVLDCIQDNNGLMWFVTNVGLSSYDGYKFENYSYSNEYNYFWNAFIRSFSNGEFIIIPFIEKKQIIFFSKGNFSYLDIPLKTTDIILSVDVMEIDNKKIVGLGTTTGFYIFKDSSFTRYTTKDGLANDTVTCVKSINNKFYLGTFGGLTIFRNNKLYKYNENVKGIELFRDKRIYQIDFFSHKENQFYILGENFLGLLDYNNFQKYDFDLKEFNFEKVGFLNFFPSLKADKYGNVFFSTPKEKFCYFTKRNTIIKLISENGFNSNGANSIYIDKEGNIWFVNNRGIEKFGGFKFINFDHNSGLIGDEVTSIIKRKNGDIILGQNYGLSILQNFKVKKTIYLSSDEFLNSNNRIQDMELDEFGRVWFAASWLGVGYLDNDNNVKWVEKGKNYQFYSVVTDNKGTMWVAASNKLYKVINGKLELYPINIKNNFRKIFEFGDSLIILTPGKVVYLLVNDKIITFSDTLNKDFKNFFSAYKDDDGSLLIGCWNGLFRIKDNKIEKIDLCLPKNNSSIFFITKTSRNTYWLGTGNGIVKWENNRCVNYSEYDGLIGNETNRDGIFYDRINNLLYIGTHKGLSIMNLNYEEQIEPPRFLEILNIEKSDGTKLDVTEPISLSYYDRNLFFNFRAISFNNEREISYRVKLEGFDKDWIELGQEVKGKIRYTNLSPGKYRFTFQAKNKGSDWSRIISSNVITIESPFYLKWWFITFVIFGLISLAYAVFQYINKINQLNQELKSLNENKDKFFSILSHDLRSPFHGLIGFLDVIITNYDKLPKEKIINMLKTVQSVTKQLFNMVEDLLQWSRLQNKTIELNIERLNLHNLLIDIRNILLSNLKEKNITLEIEISSDTEAKADINLFRSLFYNIISNSIKFSNRNGLIKIYSLENEANFIINIEDNGVGIPEEKLSRLFKVGESVSSKGTLGETGSGLGLILCKEIVEIHRGKIRIESKENEGTKVELIFLKDMFSKTN